jgi:hypothetical protein
MEAQPHGTGILGMEAVAHNLRPYAARRPQFADLLKEIYVRIEKER